MANLSYKWPGTGQVTELTGKPWQVEEYKPLRHSKKNYMQGVKDGAENVLFRQNIFGTELIWNTVRYFFPSRAGKRSVHSLFIFSMVKRDAQKFIKTNAVRLPHKTMSVVYNNDAAINRKKIIATDINDAYWTIAKNKKIISLKTYYRGLDINEKNMLVAALSSLGRDKRYIQYKDGYPTKDVVLIKGDDNLKQLYKLIRFTCFGYMKKLAKLLGNDFIAYKTDCIYYVCTPANIKKVKAFLERRELEYKMLTDDDFDTKNIKENIYE